MKMKTEMKKILISFLLFSFPTSTFISSAYARGWITKVNVFRITKEGSQQNGPVIHKNLVIWTDWRGGKQTSLDIYGYDLKKKKEFPILVREGQQWAAGYNGRYVIYNQYFSADDPKSYDVRAYDLETGKDIVITDEVGSQWATDVFRNKVVYIDGGGYGDLYLYNLRTKSKKFIASNAAVPRIWKNYIVWYISKGPGKFDIRAYDLRNKQLINIPNPEGASRRWPDVYMFNVAYTYSKNNAHSVRIFNLLTRKERIIYETFTAAVDRPAISNRYVVWSQSSKKHVGGVMGADLWAREVFEAQEQGPHQNSVTTPAIWGKTAVWMAWRTGNGDIYGATFITSPMGKYWPF